jgi:hypothetical protein
MTIGFSFGWKTIVAVLVVLIVLAASTIAGTEYYTSQPEFCGGTCHTMREQYDAWQASKHNTKNNPGHKQAACVDCHFPPGEKRTLTAEFVGLRYMFAYLADPGAPIPKRPLVKDEACLRSGCHAKDTFQDKEFKFTEKFSFKHRAHLEKPIEGQRLHCDTCHIKFSRDKHFEVPREVCFLCHFRKTNFNQGRSRCALCHAVPTKSLQRQKSADDPDAAPITHQTLEKAKVPCQSCHYPLVKGEGAIKTEDCRDCHRDKKTLAALERNGQRKVMHERHVATQQALCFDCHEPIQHQEKAEFLDPVRTNCALCHPDHHRFQKLLLLGAGQEDVAAAPGLMTAVKTNCTGCHISTDHNKGQTVMRGSGKACADCHTEKDKQMLEDWKQTLSKELKFAKELEEEARQAIDAARGKVPDEKLKEAVALLEMGRENLHIVEYGNGVHNKKYSIMLLDAAMINFEDLVDAISEGG